jgi:HAD superfamily hydrolase (TIGR01549 family)
MLVASRAPASAYIFDFDGTLGTIPVDWQRVKEGLREATGSQEEFKNVFPTIVHILEENPKVQRRVFALIDEYEVDAAPRAVLYPDSFDLLQALAETAKVSLVTMQGPKATEMVLQRFNLKQFFVHRFTREDSLDRGEQLRFALEAMRAKKESSVFVGDRLNDLNAAKRVGVPFTMIRTHGDDPQDEDVLLYHSVTEFFETVRH